MIRKIFNTSLLVFVLTFIPSLRSHEQTIVSKTIKIEIKEYANAFNPSIIDAEDGYLLVFRYIPDSKHSNISGIGIVRLNENFETISKPQELNTRHFSDMTLSQAEDARLFRFGDKIYVTYNDNEEEYVYSYLQRREIFMAELIENEGKFFLGKPLKLIHSLKHPHVMWQKNWMPFEWNGKLLMTYKVAPHEILLTNLKNGVCQPFSIFDPKINFWSWGELRGGTPPQLLNGEYLGFFHSSISIKDKKSRKKNWIYYMGAYTFSAVRPFTITKISKEPIVQNSFYDEFVNFKKVIFPGGFVKKGDTLYLAYGRNDCELWIARIELDNLYQSLRKTGKNYRSNRFLTPL